LQDNFTKPLVPLILSAYKDLSLHSLINNLSTELGKPLPSTTPPFIKHPASLTHNLFLISSSDLQALYQILRIFCARCASPSHSILPLVLSESLQSYLSELFASDDSIILDATTKEDSDLDALLSQLSHLDSALSYLQAFLDSEGELLNSAL
jgi:hypothetical protein